MADSTTQTVVGALAGAGIAARTPLKWGWASGSLSQIAASWAIAPLIAAGFSATLFMTLKYSVLERKDPMKWGLRLIPWYVILTSIHPQVIESHRRTYEVSTADLCLRNY